VTCRKYRYIDLVVAVGMAQKKPELEARCENYDPKMNYAFNGSVMNLILL